MAFKFNSNTPSNIVYNEKPVRKLIYNGNTVWSLNNITVFTATFQSDDDVLKTMTETSRNIDTSMLTSVMSPTGISASEQNVDEKTTSTVLAATTAAKSIYNYATVTFRSLQYAAYGEIKTTVQDKTLYNISNCGQQMKKYTMKFNLNGDWTAIIQVNNKSSYYGCDNNLAVESIVLSVS